MKCGRNRAATWIRLNLNMTYAVRSLLGLVGLNMVWVRLGLKNIPNSDMGWAWVTVFGIPTRPDPFPSVHVSLWVVSISNI